MRVAKGKLVIFLAAAILAWPAIQLGPLAGGTSELFKTSSGLTSAELKISVPPGYNSSLSFTLPADCSVQSARFDIQAAPVRIPSALTENGPSAFLTGTALDNIVYTNGSLRLADLARSAEFTDWQGSLACGTAVAGGRLQLARNTGDMDFSPNTRPGPSNQSEYDPAVAVAPDDSVHVAWTDQREFDLNIYYARSLDRGTSWTGALKINDDLAAKHARQESPDLAAANGNRVYIVWTDNRSGDEDIYLAASGDGGASFSSNRRVDDGPPGTNASYPSIAVLPSGKLAVAWEDTRSGSKDIRCAYSADGLTFGTSVQVNTDLSGREQFRPKVAAGTQDIFHVVWYDNRSGDFDIYYARSSGSGFQAETRVDDSGDSGTFQALPSVAVGPQERVHIVWHDTRYDGYRIMYSSSQDGIDFTPNRMVSPASGIGKDQFQPRIRVGPGGILHVSWHDRRYGDPDIFYANSTTNGASFTPAWRVDNTAREVLSYSPAIGVDSLGEVHIVWWDNRTPATYGTTFQILYSRGGNPYFGAGNFVSPVIDLGIAPSALVCATAGISAPDGTCVMIYLATGSDPSGPTDAPVNISLVGRPFGPAPGRYIRWFVHLESRELTRSPSTGSVRLDYLVHPVFGTFRSRPIALQFPLRSADVYWNEGREGNGTASLAMELSANNGSSWQEARPGLQFEFTGTGRVVMYRMTFTGSSASTPTLSSVFLDLRMESLPSDLAISSGRSGTTVWSLPGQMAAGVVQSGPELKEAFNRAIQDARKTSRENATVAFNFTSPTPGIVEVGNIRILYDRPPRIFSRDPEASPTLEEGTALSFSVLAEDQDNDPLSSRWLLDGIAVEEGALSFIYRPDHSDSGVHNLTVTVSDGILSVSATWMVTVRDLNRAPVIKTSSPEPRIPLKAREVQRFAVDASDPDGDLLTYSWRVSGAPVGAQDEFFDFSAPAAPGTYSIEVNISDGEDSVTRAWQVDVFMPAAPPVEKAPFPYVIAAAVVLMVLSALLAARMAIRPNKRRRRRRARK